MRCALPVFVLALAACHAAPPADRATDVERPDTAGIDASDDPMDDTLVDPDVASQTDTGRASDGTDSTAPDAPPDAVDGDPYVFEPWLAEPLPLDTFLCADAAADPVGTPDKVNIECVVEGGNFADQDAPPADRLVVMAYNMERGVHLDEQIALLRDSPAVPRADVLLISEIDRGCSRSGARNGMAELAAALGMNYAYGVEFVELPRAAGSGGTITASCEHGNAIASRYPLGNVRQVRHEANVSWYDPDTPGTGEPRLGGRTYIAADVRVGDRYVHVYSLHFESHPINGDIRDAQAAEVAEDGAGRPYAVVIGGDTNAPLYWLDVQNGTSADPTVAEFFARGYTDAHGALPGAARSTTATGLVLDLIFGSDEFLADPGIGPAEAVDSLSDHRPVWATVLLR